MNASLLIFSQRPHSPAGLSTEAILRPQISHVPFIFISPSTTHLRQAQLTARLSLPKRKRQQPVIASAPQATFHVLYCQA